MLSNKVLARWTVAFIWMAAIFVASTDLMSAEHTSRFVGPFLHWLMPSILPSTVGKVQFAVRKAAHLTEYAMLAMLLLRAVQVGLSRIRWRSAVLVIGFCACYASLDEFHQSFVVSRTASPADAMIDTCGAVAGLLIYSTWQRQRKRAAASATS